MALDWNTVADSTRRRRGRSRAPGVLLLVVLLAGAGGGVYYFFSSRGDNNGELPPTESPSIRTPTDESGGLYGIPTAGPHIAVPGEDLLLDGRFDEAAKKLKEFLSSAQGERADRTRYLLAKCYYRMEQPQEAKPLFEACLESAYGGEAACALGKMAEKAGKRAEAIRYYERARENHPDSKGGRLAGLRLADWLYEAHAGRRVDRSKWEKIWRFYSAGVEVCGEGERRLVVRRLEKLAKYVLFDRNYSSARLSFFHEVQPGEILEKIAKRYRVSVGVIRAANGIPPDSDLIRAEQRLKILRGETAVLVRRSKFRLTVLIDGCFYKEFPVGVGASDTPTPTGEFIVERKSADPPYTVDGTEYPMGHEKNPLGTRWIGFADRPGATGIGIHGSNPDGAGVGGMKSKGCIRMRNRDVEELYDLVREDIQGVDGTRVAVVE